MRLAAIRRLMCHLKMGVDECIVRAYIYLYIVSPNPEQHVTAY